MKARTLFRAVSLAIAAFGGVACSSGSSDSHDSVEQTGTIEASLTAVGPDGATYTLPINTDLLLSWYGEAGTNSQFVYFDSTSPTQSFAVAPGIYTGTLSNTMTLTRIADSGPTIVPATLVDPQPYNFTVTAGQTTSLTFHFTIAGIGDVAFTTGTLSTHLQVDAGTASAGHILVTGSTSVSAVLNGPAALNMALTPTGPVAVSYSVSASLTSPFSVGVESACAPIKGTINTTTDSANNDPIFASLMNEASGGTGTVCIYDANSSEDPGQVFLTFNRIGAPETSAITGVLGSTAQAGESFFFQIYGTPATPLFDGTTLHLSEINQPMNMPANIIAAGYEPNNTYVAQGNSSTMTLQVTP
jgi:hypothetical protein